MTADLKGPPDVRPWYELDSWKGSGCPSTLKRKFGFVKTHYAKLASAEIKLADYKAKPKTKQSERIVERLKAQVENRRAWLRYSVANLEAHCYYAEARFSGELEEIRSRGTGRPRGVTQGKKNGEAKKIRKLVSYFRQIIPTYLQCLAVAEGTSDREEAMAALIDTTKPVVDVWKRKSGREIEEAEQLAWIEIIDTAKRFDPTSSNMSQFNTYFSWRCRRATQIRKDADCPPGRQRVKGKIVARSTIHATDDEARGDGLHPVTTDSYDEAKGAVALALSALTPEEQEIAIKHLMEGVSLRNLAEERGETVHKVRAKVNEVKAKLRESLGEFGDE